MALQQQHRTIRGFTLQEIDSALTSILSASTSRRDVDTLTQLATAFEAQSMAAWCYVCNTEECFHMRTKDWMRRMLTAILIRIYTQPDSVSRVFINLRFKRCIQSRFTRLCASLLDLHDLGYVTLDALSTGACNMLYLTGLESARFAEDLFIRWSRKTRSRARSRLGPYTHVYAFFYSPASLGPFPAIDSLITPDAEHVDTREHPIWNLYDHHYPSSRTFIKLRKAQLAYRKNIVAALTFCFSALQLPGFAHLVAARLLY